MIFLWNQERILLEIIELARLRISDRLDIPMQLVNAEVRLENGVVKPQFQVHSKDIPHMQATEVEFAIGDIWKELKGELSFRLSSIGMVYYGGKET